MIIKSLSVTNFRNHKSTALRFSSGANILVGANAQGKTNLLEAVYLTCVGRGWRTHRDKEMINFDADYARIKTTVTKSFGDCSVEIALSKSAKKTIKLNDIPIQKMGELMGQVNCVFFSPDELRLIKDAPADRRRFMDIDISQIDKAYFYSLLRYNKILLQRNALLRAMSPNVTASPTLKATPVSSKHATENFEAQDRFRGLGIWTAQLAKAGAAIIVRRLRFIEQLKNNIAKVHNYLTGGKEEISISYTNITNSNKEECTYSAEPDKQVAMMTEQEIESALLSQIDSVLTNDLRLKTTTVGPHRDDLRILIDGKDVRYFGSQGQQRTVALSIKLSELEIFKAITGEMPVLLLDDVLSELDSDRQSRLIKALSKCQSIITATSCPVGAAFSSVFDVNGGKVSFDNSKL
jgi:DNA replication and repair protein RecF